MLHSGSVNQAIRTELVDKPGSTGRKGKNLIDRSVSEYVLLYIGVLQLTCNKSAGFSPVKSGESASDIYTLPDSGK